MRGRGGTTVGAAAVGRAVGEEHHRGVRQLAGTSDRRAVPASGQAGVLGERVERREDRLADRGAVGRARRGGSRRARACDRSTARRRRRRCPRTARHRRGSTRGRSWTNWTAAFLRGGDAVGARRRRRPSTSTCRPRRSPSRPSPARRPTGPGRADATTTIVEREQQAHQRARRSATRVGAARATRTCRAPRTRRGRAAAAAPTRPRTRPRRRR